MIDFQGPRPFFDLGNRRKWHLSTAGRRQVDRGKRGERILDGGVRLQNNAILIGLGEDGGNDALTEGIIERVVDCGGGHAKPRGGIAIHGNKRGKTVVQIVGRNIFKFGRTLQTIDELWYGLVQGQAGCRLHTIDTGRGRSWI